MHQTVFKSYRLVLPEKAYDMWLEIARGLEKDGYEVEKQFPLELV